MVNLPYLDLSDTHPLAKIFYLVAIFLLVLGGFDMWVWAQGSAQPEPVTLAQLGVDNGTDNTNLIISDYIVGEPLFDRRDDVTTSLVWVPLLNRQGELTDRPVIVFGRPTQGSEVIAGLKLQMPFRGVVSKSQGLGVYRKADFGVMYPDADFDRAICIHWDKGFPSGFKAIGLCVGGTMSFLLAIVVVRMDTKQDVVWA